MSRAGKCYEPPMRERDMIAGNPMALGSPLCRGEIPCSTSCSSSGSSCSACTSLTSVSPIACETGWLASAGRAAPVPMEFICGGRVSCVEFLWRSGPISRRHEFIPSVFSSRERRRSASADAPSGTRGRRTIGERGAGRNRHHPRRPSGRGAGHYPCPAGLRHRLAAIADGPPRYRRPARRPTPFGARIHSITNFACLGRGQQGALDVRRRPDRDRLRHAGSCDRLHLCLRPAVRGPTC
jgi:hypothetical protein